MALTDIQVKSFKAAEKPFRKADAKGLYLEVTKSGGKLWRFKYRLNSVEKKLALGAYPDVGLSDARRMRDEARALVALGGDPSAQRQRNKVIAKIQSANTFAGVAEEYITNKLVGEGKADTTVAKSRWLLRLMSTGLGKRPIAEIEPYEIIAVLKRIEASGRHETAIRCLSFASRIFRYGVVTTRCKADPAALLQGSLRSPKVKHHAAILDPKGVGKMLRSIDDYAGNVATLKALQIAPHVFVRPGELRQARWEQFDLVGAVWQIPSDKRKDRKPHVVPLSEQVLKHLESLAEAVGNEGYLFPSVRTRSRSISNNTLNAAFRRMGYTSEELTAHGLRSTASTLLNESGLWSYDAIERALSHGDTNQVRAAYHRGAHWPERVKMAQWWSDYLDSLRDEAI